MNARKKLLISCALGTGLIVGIYSALSPTIYKAIVQVHISDAGPSSFLIRDNETMQKYINEYQKILYNDEMLNSVISKLHLSISRRFMVKDPASVLRKAIEVITPEGTSLIHITVCMDNRVLALRVASVLAEEFIARIKQIDFTLTEKAIRWLTETSQLSKEITEYEHKLAKFIENNKLESLDADLKRAQNTQAAIINEIEDVAFDLSSLQSKVLYYEEIVQQSNAEEMARAFMGDEKISAIKRKKEEKENELYGLRRMHRESNSQIQFLENEIENINKEVKVQSKIILNQKMNEIENMENRLKTLNKKAAIGKKDIIKVETQKKDLANLMREVDMRMELYKMAFAKIKKEQLSVLQIAGVIIPDEEPTLTRVAPHPIRNALLGALGGFIVATIILSAADKVKIRKNVYK